jgi:hypothetical protein
MERMGMGAGEIGLGPWVVLVDSPADAGFSHHDQWQEGGGPLITTFRSGEQDAPI